MGEVGQGDRVLVGVEEEFLLIDDPTNMPAPRIAQVLHEAELLMGDQAQSELHRAQIESATKPCWTLSELREDLESLRSNLVRAADRHGAAVVASGTYPAAMGASGRLVTDDDRYHDMLEANAVLVREQLICGCHIHVSVPDPEQVIAIMNRIRRWLPLLLALSANSPFWNGEDTGFASYRTEIWSRWPTAGPPGTFANRGEYQNLLTQLVEAGVILDSGMAYWDVRPSQRFPTLEIRIADVMPSVDDVVAVAALARGLVEWCGHQPDEATLRPELIRAANWRAARSGLSGDLIDPLDASTRPAREAIDEVLRHVRPYLDARGEYQEVVALLDALFDRGNGSMRQRHTFSESEQLHAVIDSLRLKPSAAAEPVTGIARAVV
jgi:carboxylate-amine ligase